MAKPSRNNRGSTPDIVSMDWRTPQPIVRTIERHFGVTFVLDAAATPENTLCEAFITKGMNTLGMSMERIAEIHQAGWRRLQEKTVHPVTAPAIWCNPEYFTSQELLLWIDKGARFAHTMEIPWIFLLPASRTEQDWYHASIHWRAQFSHPKGRVPYNKPDGTPGDSPNHPSVVIAFNAPRAGVDQVTTLPNDWRKHLPKKASK